MGSENNCFVKKYNDLKIEFSSICCNQATIFVISLFFSIFSPLCHIKKGKPERSSFVSPPPPAVDTQHCFKPGVTITMVLVEDTISTTTGAQILSRQKLKHISFYLYTIFKTGLLKQILPQNLKKPEIMIFIFVTTLWYFFEMLESFLK